MGSPVRDIVSQSVAVKSFDKLNLSQNKIN